MALSVLGDSIERRAAEVARRESLVTRLTADDATRRQREKRSKKTRGVWAALAEAGIHLTQDQHHAVELVLRRHPELNELLLSPSEAVERLAACGVPFTDGQLALVSDETTISGLRSSACAFEDRPKRPKGPAGRVTLTATRKRVMRQPAWQRWLRKALAWVRARVSPAKASTRRLAG